MRVKFVLSNGNFFYTTVDSWNEAQSINDKSFHGKAEMTKVKDEENERNG